MKRNRRILSLLLAICLVAALIPAVATAETSVSTDVKDDEIVTFAGKDWIVMANNAAEMVLLLQTPVDPIAYNASGLSNSWDQSDAKAWCESDEVREWFSDVEWNALSEEKVYFLSHSEVVTYFANNTLADLKTADGWWLRYDGETVDSNLFGVAVSDAGFVGTPHVAANYGARPAIKIPTKNIAMVNKSADKWTLSVVSPDAFANFGATVAVAQDYASAEIDYTNAQTGNIVVALTDRVGNVLETYVNAVNAAFGSINLTLPADLMGWYTLRVYNEVGNATSDVITSSFNVEDSHGEVKGYEAIVEGDVSLNIAIDLKDNIVNENGEVVATDAYVEVTTTSGTKVFNVTELSGSSHSEANASLMMSVTAPQMNDDITIQVFDGNGGSGAKQTFSVREYAEAVIGGNYADKDKNLAKHMLNYGAMSQIYFGYNSNDLANKNIGKVDMDAVPNDGQPAKVVGDDIGLSYFGSSLVMNSKISMRFYFTLDDGADINDYTFSKGYPFYSTRDKMYRIEIDNIAPNMLATDIVVQITKGDVTKAITYSPMDYIQRQFYGTASNSLKNMLQALYNYHMAALEHTPVV